MIGGYRPSETALDIAGRDESNKPRGVTLNSKNRVSKADPEFFYFSNPAV